jgi:hypothetical protein
VAVSNPIAIAGAALAAALAALAARSTQPPAPSTCVLGAEVFYSNERTSSADTLLYVPLQGTRLRDSLIKADSLPNGALLPDVAPQFVSKRVQVCFPDSTVHAHAVLKT